MFGHMTKTLIQAAFLSLLLLIAFSLSFYMAFFRPGMEFESSPFFHPAQTFLTVMTYAFGGAEYNGIFALSHDTGTTTLVEPPFLPVSVLLWFFFLAAVLILLINMLVS